MRILNRDVQGGQTKKPWKFWKHHVSLAGEHVTNIVEMISSFDWSNVQLNILSAVDLFKCFDVSNWQNSSLKKYSIKLKYRLLDMWFKLESIKDTLWPKYINGYWYKMFNLYKIGLSDEKLSKMNFMRGKGMTFCQGVTRVYINFIFGLKENIRDINSRTGFNGLDY